MKRHILLIDPVEKLVVKKDSSILFALTLQEMGYPVFLVFERDLYYRNKGETILDGYQFSGGYNSQSFLVESFELGNSTPLELGDNDVFHMRLDPPFDSRYLRILWLLKEYQSKGVEVINDPVGIMENNEKLKAYADSKGMDSYVGTSVSGALRFMESHLEQSKNFIFKPLDLYQGIGVQKVFFDESIEENVQRVINEYQGPAVIQTFYEGVSEGEIRTIFFRGKELGTILKVPPEGEFLANIAQGASYHRTELNPVQREFCTRIARELDEIGVPWVAYDVLGDHPSEVNITCPGLLVEVSKAMERNLAIDIVKMMEDSECNQ